MESRLKGTLLVVADGRPAAGWGHVRRSFALVQAWQDAGGAFHFLTHDAAAARSLAPLIPPDALEWVADDAPGPAAISRRADECDAVWILVDDARWQSDDFRRLARSGRSVVRFHDAEADLLALSADDTVDCIVAYGPFTTPREICESSRGHVLAGVRYRPLERRWQRGREARGAHVSAEARRLLITLGGTDQREIAAALARGLDQQTERPWEIRLIGQGTPWSSTTIHAWTAVESTPDLVEHASWCDVAISAGGVTLGELLAIGVPTMALIVAENQRPGVHALSTLDVLAGCFQADAAGIAGLLEALTELRANAQRRETLSLRGREWLDDHGAERIVTALVDRGLHLRTAGIDDSELLWRWANDEKVRRMSLRTARIPWETHLRWFHERLDDKKTTLYIASRLDGTPLGQIRFQRGESGASIALSVAAEHRGGGWSARLVKQGVRRFRHEQGPAELHAFVKPVNLASQRTFARVGFQPLRDTTVHGEAVQHWHLAEAADVR